MKAVGLYQYLPIENEQSLIDIEMNCPQPMGKDLLVNVRAISVNPVDIKVRAPKNGTETTPRILGWDAAGEVIAIGSEVENFTVGDQVFYAGDITRSGSNSEYQLVDEGIVGRMPAQLDYPAAAALPINSHHDVGGIVRSPRHLAPRG
jgi:NADPH:quinone reductase